MADYKTPGVYVEEITTLPPSVAQVATAVPAFIGYTEKAERDGKSLYMTPRRITSLLDYHQMFGRGCDYGDIRVVYDKATKSVTKVVPAQQFYVYDSVRMYFANGGGECYIVSVGTYKKKGQDGKDVDNDITMDALMEGVKAVEKEDRPTMLLCPDAMLLKKDAEAYSLQQEMLMQCAKLQDRVSILDLFEGTIKREDHDMIIQNFRDGVGINNLKYGAAYYPWIETTLSHSFSFDQVHLLDKIDTELKDAIKLEDLIKDPSTVQTLRSALADIKVIEAHEDAQLVEGKSLVEQYYTLSDAAAATPNDTLKHYVTVLKKIIDAVVSLPGNAEIKNPLIKNELKQKVSLTSALAVALRGVYGIDQRASIGVMTEAVADAEYGDYKLKEALLPKGYTKVEVAADGTETEVPLPADELFKKASAALNALFETLHGIFMSIKKDAKTIRDNLDKAVFDNNPVYQNIVNEIKKEVGIMPPGGAIAGVYAQVDGARGCWKAPANVSLSSVIGPVIKFDNKEQEEMNVDTNAGKSINAIRAFTGKGTLVWGARTLAGNDNEWRYISVRRFFNFVEKSVRLSTNWAVFEPNDTATWIRVKAMIENFLTNMWKQGALAGSTPAAAFFVNIGLGTTMTQVDILEGRMNVEIGMAVVRPAEFIILKFSHKLQEA